MVRALAVEPCELDSAVVGAVPVSPADDVERRIEDWLVCYLDDRDPEPHTARFADMLETGTLTMPRPRSRAMKARGRRNLQRRHWARIAVRRGATAVVVTLLDQLLIKENVIEELAEELADVVCACDRRIVLNFSHVERMSSHIVALVAKLHHQCSGVPGGALRLCGVHPDVAGVFALTGVGPVLDTYPGEPEALGAPWPGRILPRPLPISVLSPITGSLAGGAAPSEPEPWADSGAAWPEVSADPEETSDPSFVWLLIESGPTRGCVIPVGPERFRIGSGSECNLRVPVRRFAPLHASLERRGTHVRLAVLGAGLTATVNGLVVGRTSVSLRCGDRVQLGPLVFTVISGDSFVHHAPIEELVASWVRDEPAAPQPADDESDGPGSSDVIPFVDPDDEGSDDWVTGTGLRYKVVEGVLVVLPKSTELDDAAALEQLRTGLAELAERALPVRVVVDLSHVASISSRWLGMLLAFYLRLARAGGALRLCELHARVLTVLEQFRLPVLIDVYATVEEAVISGWD